MGIKCNTFVQNPIEKTTLAEVREEILASAKAAKEAGSDCFDIPFDRQELADYLEVDRSGLSVEIGKLRREGIIDKMKEAGISDGDTVSIYDLEFDFYD